MLRLNSLMFDGEGFNKGFWYEFDNLIKIMVQTFIYPVVSVEVISEFIYIYLPRLGKRVKIHLH